MSMQPGDRWDAKVVRERNGKKYYTRIGSAFCNRDGSIGLRLDANPIDGEVYISPPYDDAGGGGGGGRRGGGGGGYTGPQQRTRNQGRPRQQGQPRRIQEDMDFPEERPSRRAPEDDGSFSDDDDGAFPE